MTNVMLQHEKSTTDLSIDHLDAKPLFIRQTFSHLISFALPCPPSAHVAPSHHAHPLPHPSLPLSRPRPSPAPPTHRGRRRVAAGADGHVTRGACHRARHVTGRAAARRPAREPASRRNGRCGETRAHPGAAAQPAPLAAGPLQRTGGSAGHVTPRRTATCHRRCCRRRADRS